MKRGQQTADVEIGENKSSVTPSKAKSVFFVSQFFTPPPPPSHVSGLLLLCSAVFQDCRAGVLTNHDAPK